MARIQAWAVWHPIHDRPMVALARMSAPVEGEAVRAWALYRTRKEARIAAKEIHSKCRAVKVFIVKEI